MIFGSKVLSSLCFLCSLVLLKAVRVTNHGVQCNHNMPWILSKTSSRFSEKLCGYWKDSEGHVIDLDFSPIPRLISIIIIMSVMSDCRTHSFQHL